MIVRAITFVVSRIVDRTGQVVTTVAWNQIGLIAPQRRNVMKTKVIVISMKTVKMVSYVEKTIVEMVWGKKGMTVA